MTSRRCKKRTSFFLKHFSTSPGRSATSWGCCDRGQAISKGTTIVLGMYATHCDEKLWERPNEFYPERFVNPEMETERHKYAFFPFGGGLHNCISATICSNACSFSSIRVSMSLKTSRIMSISAAPENETRLPRTLIDGMILKHTAQQLVAGSKGRWAKASCTLLKSAFGELC